MLLLGGRTRKYFYVENGVILRVKKCVSLCFGAFFGTIGFEKRYFLNSTKFLWINAGVCPTMNCDFCFAGNTCFQSSRNLLRHSK